jgi:response regulator RpfG family c-di-GMP phosphodiesterase
VHREYTDSQARRPRILCVDDEPNVLAALERQLRREYEVRTAEDARSAIQILLREGPFEVVTSDLRMPVVDGISFLAKVAERSPDSVRILLTGYADLDAAIAAVNRGRVFRFLTKPCQKEDLVAAIEAGLEQYRLVRAERELLDRTLRGAVRALTDVLALASPVAFGRAQRAQQTVSGLCHHLRVEKTWSIEIAALLSQIGCITLMDDTLARLHQGADLSPDETDAVRQLPDVARTLLRNIPRLEPVLEILEHQNARFEPPRRGTEGPHGEEIPIGARLLRVALDHDALELRGVLGTRAIAVLRGRQGEYDPAVLDALARLRAWDADGREIRELRLPDLRIGMILADDVLARTGALLVARGQTISDGLLLRLRAFAENVGVMEPLLIAIPADLPEESTAAAEDADDVRFEAVGLDDAVGARS